MKLLVYCMRNINPRTQYIVHSYLWIVICVVDYASEDSIRDSSSSILYYQRSVLSYNTNNHSIQLITVYLNT